MRVHGSHQHVVRGAQLHGVGVFRAEAHDRRDRSEYDYYRCVYTENDLIVNIVLTHPARMAN